MPRSQPPVRYSPQSSVVESVARPLREFLATEASGGIVLMVATVIGVVWANSPWRASYGDLWSTDLAIRLGHHVIAEDLRGWVNDGLMTVFFLVVGLEIKRELTVGELRDRRRAALPAVAALGGMVVPALLYVLCNAGGAGRDGWGIPMATDIAFALGVVALLGRRVPSSLRLFLLTLAIADDLGALVVLAVFYTGGVSWLPLGVAGALVVAVVVLERLGVGWTPVYLALGGAMWLALHDAGVHPTLAGVVMGLLAPIEPTLPEHAVAMHRAELADVSSPEAARTTVRLAREAVPVVEWLEHVLHPWVSYVVVPLFAVANVGVVLSASTLTDAAGSAVTLGVLVGLVIGKPAGITLFAFLACRTGLGTLPPGVGWRQVLGIGAVAGVGFTVALFFAGLSFTDGAVQDQAKVGILAGSLAAAGLGTALLWRSDVSH